jgi:hypothetical protein
MSQGARTKVVVRLLPPFLTEDGFKETIGAWLDATNWFTYYKGKLSALEIRHSCAFLNFKDPADVIRFKYAFDKHVFVSDKGAQYRCSVVYAPNQRVARGKGLRDNKEGTVEKDAEYKEFLARLESGTTTIDRQLEEPQGGGGGLTAPVETALMAYLKGKRAAMKKSSTGHSVNKKSKKKEVKPKPKTQETSQAPNSTASQQRAGSTVNLDKKSKDLQKKNSRRQFVKGNAKGVEPAPKVVEKRKANPKKNEVKPLVPAEVKVIKILKRSSNETGTDTTTKQSQPLQSTNIKAATRLDKDEKPKRGEGRGVASREQRGGGRGGRRQQRGRGEGRGEGQRGRGASGSTVPGRKAAGTETKNAPTVVLRPPPGLTKSTVEK